MLLASPPPPASPDLPRLHGLRLLVADASAHQHELVRDLLNSEGAEVVSAAHSALALELLRDSTTPFDAALLAADMPPMDGLATTVQLRRHPPLRRLPVIALRTPSISPETETCFMAGMNDHLDLPLDLEALVSMLLRLTHRAAALSPDARSPVLPESTQRYAEAHAIELSAALQRLGGARGNGGARYQHYLQRFLEDTTCLPARIHSLLEACDLNGVAQQWRELHAMSSMLGLVELAQATASAQRATSQAMVRQEHPSQSRAHAAQVTLTLATAQTHAAHLVHVLTAAAFISSTKRKHP